MTDELEAKRERRPCLCPAGEPHVCGDENIGATGCPDPRVRPPRLTALDEARAILEQPLRDAGEQLAEDMARGRYLTLEQARAKLAEMRSQDEHREERREMYEGLYAVPTSLGMLPGYTRPMSECGRLGHDTGPMLFAGAANQGVVCRRCETFLPC